MENLILIRMSNNFTFEGGIGHWVLLVCCPIDKLVRLIFLKIGYVLLSDYIKRNHFAKK